jgi:hypothetical protein
MNRFAFFGFQVLIQSSKLKAQSPRPKDQRSGIILGMRMLHITILLSAILVFSTAGWAQKPVPTPADFSGTWIAVQTPSEPGEGFYDQAGRPVTQRPFFEHTLTILSEGSELRVTTVYKSKETFTRIYHTDGSGEVNMSSKDPKIELASTSHVKKREFTASVSVRDANTKREKSNYEIKWKLSKDGTELTVETTSRDIASPTIIISRDISRQTYKRTS